LPGVLRLLAVAKEARQLTMLDVDVPPSVAVKEAALGSIEQVKQAVLSCDVVKPTLEAAKELIELLDPRGPKWDENVSLSSLAARLLTILGCKMVALTHGKRGAGIACKDAALDLPIFDVPKVVDATGAGDAFFGGMVAGLHHWGLPKDRKSLNLLGQLASASGAACVSVLGALPLASHSAQIIASLVPEIKPFLFSSPPLSHAPTITPTSTSHLPFSQSVQADLATVNLLMGSLDWEAISRFVDILNASRGRVFVTGIGKSGLVGRRLAASLSSVSGGDNRFTAAEYVPGGEWFHGDLGKICKDDVVIAFSYSGKTTELLALVPHVHTRKAKILAIVGLKGSALATSVENVGGVAIVAPVPTDSEPFNLVPTTSVVAQEVVANGIIREMISRRNIKKQDFLHNHPGGTIGSTAKYY